MTRRGFIGLLARSAGAVVLGWSIGLHRIGAPTSVTALSSLPDSRYLTTYILEKFVSMLKEELIFARFADGSAGSAATVRWQVP